MATEGDGGSGRTRRRGEALQQAIYDATLAQLSEVGYTRLTMEGIAQRAQTGKAALYRRWPSKRELVLDALLRALPDPREIAAGSSTRDNLLAALIVIRDVLAGQTRSPGVDVIGEVLREPELRDAFADKVIGPRLDLLESLLQQGVDRGEVAPKAVTPLITRTGPALVIQSFLFTGKAPTRQELTQIVDDILMPLLRA